MIRSILLTAFLMTSGTIFCQSLKTASYQDGSQKLNGLVTSNAGKKLPGVLILPAWKGIDDEAKTAAIELEKQGYIAFIADIYGEGNIPTDSDTAAKTSGYYKKNYEAYQKRISLALEQLKKNGAIPNKIAVIGYCFGGTGALESTRGNLPVAGVVSIHGSIGKDQTRKNGPISTKILVENPADDKGVTPEDYNNLIKEMNEGNADWQIITYAHSKHTFTDLKSPDYNEVMAKRAWNHTLMFLKEILK
ncbi:MULTISPECIES: dienelactone hydrolase family protein [Chryseobacterium]|uniref:Dienelactone hydrolase n=1 Tax=Chryseobacterium geocarposphaerae TaxID=1416776 RepID=A0ABU1L994_9FLAO|nr:MULTISPECIES: dienelactone hydrolase family protein [Chryseobacterium]MDR6403294.1 dienelactone hydrolase [Chryseobacterium geocarposphaerae]MDR6696848.1 dienelactone hydrolase [Chryseobacterium ginsenosidimutans]